MENPLFVEETDLPGGHAIHFHVMCSSESECSSSSFGFLASACASSNFQELGVVGLGLQPLGP